MLTVIAKPLQRVKAAAECSYIVIKKGAVVGGSGIVA